MLVIEFIALALILYKPLILTGSTEEIVDKVRTSPEVALP